MLSNLQSLQATETTKGVTINIFDCVAMKKPISNEKDGVTAKENTSVLYFIGRFQTRNESVLRNSKHRDDFF